MKKRFLILIVSALVILSAILMWNSAHSLAHLDRYFDVSFKKESYRLLEKRSYDSWDPAYVYVIELKKEFVSQNLNPEGFQKGYSNRTVELLEMIHEAPPTDVKSKVLRNEVTGDYLVILYHNDTGYYTLYWITV